MSYTVSLLDKSPIPEGGTAAEALQATLRLARRAEALGYRRFWVAEHHGSPTLASSAPEVLIAHLLAVTSSIRIGSGGVMLQHYSPFKVAETFRLLAALAPGRVDLGIGKAPGGLPATTRALQARHDRATRTSFDALFAELDGFVSKGASEDPALAGAQAFPQPGEAPQRVLLGGSPSSAKLAARHGWQFCYAGHFNGDVANIERSIEAYREASGRAPLLALYAYAAESGETARDALGALRIVKLHLPDGQAVNLPNEAAAAAYAAQVGASDYRLEELRPHAAAGTGEAIRAELDSLHRRFGIEEFVIDTPVAEHARRLASIEAIAGALDTVPA
ncbi:LLM class flavin-dependent oxidoreductase [Burkholderia gladioli]|uniref:LLM class flavin-dependent oxidoreductase n=1 Tax=Burkholderia gladioli TaxID=28095 RepID=UPI00163E3E24|nr:LLM class flavin-dependent oxidoreductase [Burkholderia gladioli]